jgi:hypothetical protein
MERQPGPKQHEHSTPQDRRLIAGAELEELRRRESENASSPGQENTVVEFADVPTFEQLYEQWYRGPLGLDERHEGDEGRLFAYDLYLPLQTRRGRSALRRFLRCATEAGYQFRRHEAATDHLLSTTGDEVTPLTVILGHPDNPSKVGSSPQPVGGK